MKWLLNSAVIPAGGYGAWNYRPADWDELRDFLSGDVISRVGYQETADLIATQTGLPAPELSRETSELEPGDVAAVVRLKYRVDPTKKGEKVSQGPADFEVGFLEYVAAAPDPSGPAFYWEWNDRIGSRSRRPACLVVGPNGRVEQFLGEDIKGLAKVLGSSYVKSGKWSYTTYRCISPPGTETVQWMQSFEDGIHWPQDTWEEAWAWVQELAPLARPEEVEQVIREGWPDAATRFDDNRLAIRLWDLGGEPVAPDFEDGDI